MDEMYELATNVVYIRNRDCVIKSETENCSWPLEILPPVKNKVVKKINRALTTELIVLLSYKCNLNCIYCSNDSGGKNYNHAVVKKENIIKCITFVIKNALILKKIKGISAKPARIIISGGGEPTIEWNLLTTIVETVTNFKNIYGSDIAELLIITNAQIGSEKADYLINNFDEILISCDGFSIQDKQRPRLYGGSSKRYVENFLEKLNDANKEVAIRMTVTGDALPYLKEDVDYFLNSYKTIKDVIIEPFVQVGRGVNDDIKGLNCDDFISVFDSIVRKHYENVFNSVSLLNYANNYPCQRLSGISLVLSPYNVITCCDTVTPASKLWDSMIITSIDDKDIKIQNEYQYTLPSICNSCIALDFCAGGCPMHLTELNDDEKEQFCKYKKEMVKKELIRRVDLSNKTKKIKINENTYSIYSLPRRQI